MPDDKPKDEEAIEEEEVLDDVDVDEEEEEEEDEDDETPAWAQKLTDGQDAINKRLDGIEKPVEKDEEEEDDDDEDPVEYKRGMPIEEFAAKVEDRAVKKALKLFEGKEKEKVDAQGEVEKYYTGQIKRLGDRGKNVSEEVQRDVFKFMRENNITSFVEGYYEWEQDGGKPAKPNKKKDKDDIDEDDDDPGIVPDKEKKKEKSRRIKGSGGGKKGSKKDKVYRPGRTVHDVLADIYAEDID